MGRSGKLFPCNVGMITPFSYMGYIAIILLEVFTSSISQDWKGGRKITPKIGHTRDHDLD